MLQKWSSLFVKTLNIYGLIQAIFRKSYLDALFKYQISILPLAYSCVLYGNIFIMVH